MKIGIITYHRAKNLGAMLQSYALQQTLEKYIGDCEIIDYRNEKMENNYKVKSTKEIKSIKGKIKNLLLSKKNKEFEKVREDFNSKIQKISKKTYNEKNIKEVNSEYDLFVTGSDQVWNPKLNYKDSNYFLSFVEDNKKRNSYAASFGTNKIDEEDKKEIKKELEKFNKISIREKEGQDIIKQLTNKDAELVLDPTLLLNEKNWDNLIEENRLVKEKYIFLYTIAHTPSILDFARKLAKKEKCKIIYFNSGYKKYSGMQNLNKVSPQDFLNYIKNAEYVVTSSFHGLCFSIDLHKNFYYELDKGKENNNSRLTTLTNVLGLESRKILDGKCKDTKDIDYNEIEKKLNKEREKSKNFIKNLSKN